MPAVPAVLEVNPEEPLEWNLQLAESGVLHLRLEQLTTDVFIELKGRGGRELRTEDAIRQPFGHEQLWWLAQADEALRVRIVARAEGRIRLKAFEALPNDEANRQRVRAEHLLSSGRGSDRKDSAAMERGVEDLTLARDLFSGLELQPRVCRSLCFEAHLLRDLGRLDRAEQRLRTCIDLAERHDIEDERAAAWRDLSAVELSRGDFAAALVAAETALGIAQQANLPRAITEARANIPIALARLGRRREALDIQRQIVDDARTRRDRKDLAWALVNLGANLYNLGDNSRAMEAFREARDLLTALGLKRETALVINNLGTVLTTLGDVEAARAQNARALAIRQELGDLPGQAASLVNLADTLVRLDRHSEALASYQRAVELYRGAENRWGEGFALAQLGLTHVHLQDFPRAEPALRAALEISRELEHWDTECEALAGLARMADETGNDQKARSRFGEMARVAGDHGDPYREAAARYGLARLAAKAGRDETALREIERAVDLVESVRARAGADRLRASFLHGYRDYYDLWIELLLDRTAGVDQARAFAIAERARARGLLDLLAETRGAARLRLGADADEVAGLELSIRGLQARWERAPSAEAQGLREQLESALGELELARQSLRRKHPKFAEVFEPEPLDLEAARTFLDDETVLLEYHVGTSRSWLFAVTRSGLEVHELPGEHDLAREIEAVRELISQPRRRSEGRFARAAGDLWRTLIEPAAPQLEGRQRLLVIPDGPLRTLPFEVLITPDEAASTGRSYAQMPFLLHSQEISYAPSASIAARLADLGREPRDWPLDVVAYADPVPASTEQPAATRRGLPRSGDLGRLHGSAEEAKTIAGLFPSERARLYTAEAALESRLKSDPDLRQARYLHFATHGLVDPVVPAQSALVLSGADPAGEDGLLQAYEIVDLDLQAELVTLSACESGLGRLYRGEGLVGLSRAFVYAGADRLVASLWSVSDAHTRELMAAFYRELLRDPSSPEAALRKAKLSLADRPDRAHPYIWAPFVLLRG